MFVMSDPQYLICKLLTVCLEQSHGRREFKLSDQRLAVLTAELQWQEAQLQCQQKAQLRKTKAPVLCPERSSTAAV